MEHERYQAMLTDYLEGTLAPEAAAEFEAHLGECTECRAELALARRAVAAAGALGQVEAPAHFDHRVRERARRAGLLGRRRRDRWPGANPLHPGVMLVLLMTALAGFIALGIYLHGAFTLVDAGRRVHLLTAERPEQLLGVAELVWRLGGEVGHDRRLVPPGGDLSRARLLNLGLPAAAFIEFAAGARALGLRGDLQAAQVPNAKGRLRVDVALHPAPDEPPPGP